MNSRLQVDGARLTRELEHLATFSDTPAPAVTRVLYTEQDMKARAWFKTLCEEAGLEIREDALGNVFARWHGAEPGLSAVATGSHIDAIPHSGRYDGTVGVLGGLEAIRALQKSGFEPRRSLDLILFTSEEPTRFGIGCLGSRAMAGVLSPTDIRHLKDEDGRNPDTVRCEAGFTGRLSDVHLSEDFYHAFVELHIEQGPLLEQKGLDIGVVTAIAAPATLNLTLTGSGGHAGAVLMPERRDALLAGAEIALAVEEAARTSGSVDTVATVGVFDVHPRAVNSIPSHVTMTIDARDTDLARRDHMVERIKKAVEDISSGRNVGAELSVLNADPPAVCAPEVIRGVEAAAKDLGLSSLPMVSRAYHDTLFMARLCPVGMIFIPCRDGVSHRTDEYASPEAIWNGVQTLALTLAGLAI
ncbi:Zn-dependent hydrolase [soil metagenome]